jgi:hypothetical protein
MKLKDLLLVNKYKEALKAQIKAQFKKQITLI